MYFPNAAKRLPFGAGVLMSGNPVSHEKNLLVIAAQRGQSGLQQQECRNRRSHATAS